MDFNQLTAGVNLDDAGREGVEVTGGGKFSRAVPSGWYLACLNRVATLGQITGMQPTGGGQSELQTKELMKIGFELLELVKPLDAKDADFQMKKTYKNDDGTVDEVPYEVDLNGMFGVKRSSHESAALPQILSALQEALPTDTYTKAVESHGTVQARYPTVKSMFGQQFIVYVQNFERNGREHNEVLFTKGKAEEYTNFNTKTGTPKTVKKGIEIYSADEGNRKMGIIGGKFGTPTHKKAILFDIGANDMNQVNFDSIAQESIYIGKDALAGHGDMVRFCTLVNLYSKLGKYRDMPFGALLSNGSITIPEPLPYKEAKKDDKAPDDNFDDASAIKAVAPVKTVAPVAGEEEYQV